MTESLPPAVSALAIDLPSLTVTVPPDAGRQIASAHDPEAAARSLVGAAATQVAAAVAKDIARRAWDLTERGYGTTYTTERIVPDIEAIR